MACRGRGCGTGGAWDGGEGSLCTAPTSTPPGPEAEPRKEQATFKFQIGLRGLRVCLDVKIEARLCAWAPRTPPTGSLF